MGRTLQSLRPPLGGSSNDRNRDEGTLLQFWPEIKIIINRQTTIKRALPPSALKTTVDSFEEMVQRLKETKNKKGRHSHRNSADKRLKLGKDQSTAP